MDRPLHKDIRGTEKADLRALELRHNLSMPERILWWCLKDRKLGGFKFRRQHPLGPFVADFYCHEAALVVELDSEWHRYEGEKRDRDRDDWMTERKLAVLRVTAISVNTERSVVLDRILKTVQERVELLGRSKKTDVAPPT